MSVEHNPTSIKAKNKEKRYNQQLQDAVAIAFVSLAESGQIDGVTASEQSELFTEWAADVAYTPGQLRRYNDTLYKCVQQHTAQADWTPENAPTLWAKTSDPADEWPAWSPPVGAHDAYPLGAKVTHNNKHYISAVDGNVWEPGAAGIGSNIWEESE